MCKIPQGIAVPFIFLENRSQYGQTDLCKRIRCRIILYAQEPPASRPPSDGKLKVTDQQRNRTD